MGENTPQTDEAAATRKILGFALAPAAKHEHARLPARRPRIGGQAGSEGGAPQVFALPK
jgi:hypothetical protein